MKHVVTIGELYKLIPEAKKLEGANFKDMKTLITSVIEAVEKSGSWEYVQYIFGNPSLFVVKEKEVIATQTVNYPSVNMEVEAHYNSLFNKKENRKKNKNSKPSREEKKEETIEEPLYTSSPDGNSNIFPTTKMPW